MDTVKLSIMERESTGDGPARRLRAAGRLPGVLYGKGLEPKPVSLDAEELVMAMHQHGHNVILELDLGDAGKAAKGKKKAAGKKPSGGKSSAKKQPAKKPPAKKAKKAASDSAKENA